MNLNMAMNLKTVKSSVNFTPPLEGELIQSGNGNYYDAGDGVGILRDDDSTGRGNYLLYDETPVVLPVAESDRAVGNFGIGDYIDLGTACRPNNNLVTGNVRYNPKSLGFQWLFGIEKVYKIRTNGDGKLEVLIGDGSGWIDVVSSIIQLAIGEWYDIQWSFDYTGSASPYSYLKVNGVTVWSGVTQYSFLGTSNNTYLGGNPTLPESSDAYMYNLQCGGDPLIPINEGSGADIKNINGFSVGTLTDVPTTDYWAEGIANLINQNPNPATADGVILAGRGFSGWQTRQVLDGLDDQLISFNTPNDNLTPYKTKQYEAGTVLDSNQILSINTNNRR